MRNHIYSAIKHALESLGASGLEFVVERPHDLSHGDYATNAALVAAKPLGKSPREVATALTSLLKEQLPTIETIDIAGPGFINFSVSRATLSLSLAQIIESPSEWGRSDTEAGEVVLIEYTSPNLFKPLHIGNLVGNIIGEAFTRLFEFAGAHVERLNYPSDIGLTVAKGVWGLTQTGGDPHDIMALGAAYRVGNDAYEAGGPQKEAIDAVNRALYAKNDPNLNELREVGIATSKARLYELCQKLGTRFDYEKTESEVSARGEEIVRSALGTVFTESDGAVVYHGEKVGLHTRVFLTSQGLPTYEAKDVGNFTYKEARYPNWTRSIIVTGNEQAEYFKVLYAALKELFPTAKERALEHIPTGFLTLTTGKMSSRKGNVLTGESSLEELEAEARSRATVEGADLDALSEQVAVAALKYQILRHSIGSNIVFDQEKALSFEGDSGPYLQYTHARITSVLTKAAQVNVLPDTKNAPTKAYRLERILPHFPDVIVTALNERAPHKVITYLTELASEFNSFYSQEKIADPTDPFAPYKASLAAATKTTLHNGLWVLGITAPERM